MIWIAPTERQIHEYLSTTELPWKISSLPEKHGCDILIPTKSGVVGFQRKTLPDLVASLQDGRLYYELNQMQSSATVSVSFLVVESSFTTTVDGEYYAEANVSVSAFRSLVVKFHHFGTGFLPTESPSDTVTCAHSVARYISSGRIGQVHRAKQLANEWGQTNSKAYGIFLLQSFPGIGPKVAEAIYDYFGGAPITWAVNAGELAMVPGIGRKRAEALIRSLAPGGSVRPG